MLNNEHACVYSGVHNGHIGNCAFKEPYRSDKGTLYKYNSKRITLDCDQSNYASRIVFSHIPIELVQTGNNAIRSADPENPILEPNTE